jgi:hypothetical protein
MNFRPHPIVTAPYASYVKNFSIDKSDFVFTEEQTETATDTLRRIGLDLLWDLRDELLPNAPMMNQRLEEMRLKYAPYDRIYIDAFKQDALAPGSPEFLVIWRAKDDAVKYRREILGLGLITTGRRTDSRWSLAGGKGQSGNTPDGVFRLFGFNKYYISTGGDDMRGLVMLSYANGKPFSGRGLHHVFFRSPWGSNASHGCFRVYTGAKEQGLANLIWASINPLQLDQVDHIDFGVTGAKQEFTETQSVRDIVRYMRENVWISNFSEHEDGYSFTSDATYSRFIRGQYENHQNFSGVSVLEAAKELLKREQTIMGASGTHNGRYWAYDAGVREKLFEIDLTKKSKKRD